MSLGICGVRRSFRPLRFLVGGMWVWTVACGSRQTGAVVERGDMDTGAGVGTEATSAAAGEEFATAPGIAAPAADSETDSSATSVDSPEVAAPPAAAMPGQDASGTDSPRSAVSDRDGGTEVRADGYRLVWQDEFDGLAIDASKWEHEVDCWGGGNNEDQCYVSDDKNSFVKDGALHIVALADQPSGAVAGPNADPNVVTRAYSSARLRTLGRGDWKYGRVEVAAQLPYGQGLWPAIWMLPSEEVYGGWARSGEIDILEAVNLRVPGETENRVYGTLHYGDSWPQNVQSGGYADPSSDVTRGYHLYVIEWEEGELRWFVDDELYLTQNEWHSEGNEFPAPFDQAFHLLLNVAVGGGWPGPTNSDTEFPQEMRVDYVRVFTCDADPQTGHGCGSRHSSP